jgi:hypothetical protein
MLSAIPSGTGFDLGETPQKLCTVQASFSGHQEPLIYVHKHWASVQVEPTTCLVLMQAACSPSLLEYSKKAHSQSSP